MVEKVKRKAKRKVLSGHRYLLSKKDSFIKKPVLGALYEILTGFQKQHVTAMAAESAYYIILAFFPFLIFIVGVLGFIGQQRDLASTLLSEVDKIIPEPLYGVIASFLFETMDSSNLTLLSFSMIGVIWASSNGFAVLLSGLDKAYDDTHTHSFFVLRGLGLIFTILIGIGILLSLIMVGFGGLLISELQKWIQHDFLTSTTIQLIRFAASFGMLFFVFMLLYIITATKSQRIQKAFPGALFSAGGWVALTLGFSWYVNNFDRYARLYGSIAGLIILMVWIYLCCNILLLGGIINAVIYSRRNARKEKNKELESDKSAFRT